MIGPKSPFEEIKALAKSTLASQVKDALDSSECADDQVEAVCRLVEPFIDPKPADNSSEAIQALVKSALAYQVRDVAREKMMSPEEKVRHIRGLVQHFIVNPG